MTSICEEMVALAIVLATEALGAGPMAVGKAKLYLVAAIDIAAIKVATIDTIVKESATAGAVITAIAIEPMAMVLSEG